MGLRYHITLGTEIFRTLQYRLGSVQCMRGAARPKKWTRRLFSLDLPREMAAKGCQKIQPTARLDPESAANKQQTQNLSVKSLAPETTTSFECEFLILTGRSSLARLESEASLLCSIRIASGDHRCIKLTKCKVLLPRPPSTPRHHLATQVATKAQSVLLSVCLS